MEAHERSTIVGLALAIHRGDADGFERVGPEAAQEPGFIPAIFETIIYLAQELAIERGTTAEAVLEQMAELASRGEAGLFDTDDSD